jgi:predicted alpha/beta-hydrolase family hydrolase
MPDAAQVEAFSKPLDPPVRGFLHYPETPTGNALVLTHGAGGNAQASLLVALAEAFSRHGFIVLRCNLPYRQARPFGPPGPADAARDRSGLKNAIAAIKSEVMRVATGAPFLAGVARSGDFDVSPSAAVDSARTKGDEPEAIRIFLAGHSYGGRQSSMLCAEEPNLTAGLLLLSYPLHPPRRPEQQRTQHLPDLRTPTLFVHGTRDPFGTTEELQRAIKMIPAKTKLLDLEGAGHDLGFKGQAKKAELPSQIFSAFAEFFGLSS